MTDSGGDNRSRHRVGGREAPLRLGLVAAFPFPLPHGSQVFVREQAAALARAGAEVTLFCYGRGRGAPPRDLRVVRPPACLTPVALASGPAWGKPLADASLAAWLLGHVARLRVDALLAHNAEGALVAFAARRLLGVPVVYVAHTILRHELPAYAPRCSGRPFAALGARLDAVLAGAADGVIALSAAGERLLAACARAPLARIPPGLERRPPPSAEAVAATCRRHRLEPRRYVLYLGNLDPYQRLGELAEAARSLPVPVVVGTHTRRGFAPPPLRTLRLGGVEEARRLAFAARVAVAPRAAPGGFPIKLLLYMESGVPIVARTQAAGDLEHGESAWLVPPGGGGAALATALRTLWADAALAQRLGRGARERLEREHRWERLAERTLALIDRVRNTDRRPRAEPRRSFCPGAGRDGPAATCC